ncbi:hypothetical protein H6G33_03510 [Calothrix sp. FACHB-1219]|nr:hypothetical protein [Calothrix sp. FACHB-168]MBD2202970.1 hypothetical protein [Calothrix sp. FACHB-168]MBD2216098.1 hypothetical protein [Calothrix sp. FACHB-1219]
MLVFFDGDRAGDFSYRPLKVNPLVVTGEIAIIAAHLIAMTSMRLVL